MKFFQKVNMLSETVKSANRTGLYQASGSNAAIDSGAFVVTSTLTSNDTYNTFTSGSMKDWNTFIINAPSAVTAKNVYVVDVVKVNEVVDSTNSNTYRIGAKTLAQAAVAGEKVRIRSLELNDQFILGADNFASTPTVGQYAILTAGSTVLSGSAGAGSNFAILVDQAVSLSQGITADGSGYLCHVVQL